MQRLFLRLLALRLDGLLRSFIDSTESDAILRTEICQGGLVVGHRQDMHSTSRFRNLVIGSVSSGHRWRLGSQR